MASMTHQSLSIDGVVHPSGKRETEFPKLRGGTADRDETEREHSQTLKQYPLEC